MAHMNDRMGKLADERVVGDINNRCATLFIEALQ